MARFYMIFKRELLNFIKTKDSKSYYKLKDNMPAFCLTLTQYPNCKTIFNITKKITCGHFTVLSCVMTL